MDCAVPTGMGAVRNTAKIEPGSIVDINPSKFLLTKALGAIECVNPKDYDAPIQEVLVEMTGGSLEYTFEAIGNVDPMHAALETRHNGWDACTVISVAGASSRDYHPPVPAGHGSCLARNRLWRRQRPQRTARHGR